MKEIKVLDKFSAAKHKPLPRTVLIRIFGSDPLINMTYPPLQHGESFARILEYVFDDLTPVQFEEYLAEGHKGLKLFSASHAEQIISDFNRVRVVSDHLVAHCNAGESRGPALAAALNHIFKFGIADEDYLYSDCRPNMHVYATLVYVARERFGLEFKARLHGE